MEINNTFFEIKGNLARAKKMSTGNNSTETTNTAATTQASDPPTSQDITLPVDIQFRRNDGLTAHGKLLYYGKKSKSICRIDEIESSKHEPIPAEIQELKGKYYSSIGGVAKLFKQVNYDVNGWVEGFHIMVDGSWRRFKKGEDTSLVVNRFRNTLPVSSFNNVITVPSAPRESKKRTTTTEPLNETTKKRKENEPHEQTEQTSKLQQTSKLTTIQPAVMLPQTDTTDTVEQSLKQMLDMHKHYKEKIASLEEELLQKDKQIAEYAQKIETQQNMLESIKKILLQ